MTSKTGTAKQADVLTDDEIKRLLSRPGISPDELLSSKLIPISRNGLYEALSRGDIESFRIGKKIIIPTAPLRRKLGIDAA
jgi:hypothetical protein